MANDLYKDYVNIASTGLKRNMFSGNQVGTRSIYDKNRLQDAKADMPASQGLLGKIFGRNKKNSDYRPGNPTTEKSFFSQHPEFAEDTVDNTDYTDEEQTGDSTPDDVTDDDGKIKK